MYGWYRNAAKCYAYLSDVSATGSDPTCVVFRKSRWFTRGWTLQELLAPTSVEFFSREGTLLGDRESFMEEIVETTGIALEALQGQPLAQFSIDERMKWASGRKTKREEDEAYSLLGLLGIQLPLIYGEGRENAFRRLRKELHESLPDVNRANPAGNVHWMVPRTLNSLFTGRTELIHQIRDGFRLETSQDAIQQKRLVITGLGGQGKSEICLKVASLMREDFWGVFWVDVGSRSSAKNDFLNVAKVLGSSAATVDESLQALASIKRRWLLVLDNADDPGFDYAAYFPSGSYGAVIMTSRVPQCSRYSNVDPIVLEGLDLKHSTQLLWKAAQVPEKSRLSCTAQAQDIVLLLGSHTLALVQAGAYIAEGYCQLDQYPEKYRQQRKRLLEHHPEQEQSRYRDVYATFEASADVLEHSKSEVGRDALDLLAILSTLHFSVFPLQVFKDAWRGAKHASQVENSGTWKDDIPTQQHKSRLPWLFKYARTSGMRVFRAKRSTVGQVDAFGPQHASQLPEFVGVRAENWDDHRLKRASALLTTLSLVTRHQADGMDGLSMHPLIHAWAKDRLNEERQRQAWVSTGCLLALSRWQLEILSVYEIELWPHMQAFLSPRFDTLFSYGSRKVMLPIVMECGQMLNMMREDEKLESLLRVIYQELRITWSKPSQKYLPIWDLAAINLSHMGSAEKAVALLQYIVKVRDTTLEETHPDRLASQHSLAFAYQANGQAKEAMALLEHVVKFRRTTLKETDPDQLASQHELARTYQSDGQIKKAVAMLEHVVKVQETTLKETHPDRLVSQHELASVYLADRQIKEALALLEHVVKIRKATLKETHPDRLASQHELAVAYDADGRIHEAIALLKHVVKLKKASLSPAHPSREVSESLLSTLLLDVE